MNIVKSGIGNALTSLATDHVVATTNDLYDEKIEAYQEDINNSILEGIEELKLEHSALTIAISSSTELLINEINLSYSGLTDIISSSSITILNNISNGNSGLTQTVSSYTSMIISELKNDYSSLSHEITNSYSAISSDINNSTNIILSSTTKISSDINNSTNGILSSITKNSSDIKEKLDNLDLSKETNKILSATSAQTEVIKSYIPDDYAKEKTLLSAYTCIENIKSALISGGTSITYSHSFKDGETGDNFFVIKGSTGKSETSITVDEGDYKASFPEYLKIDNKGSIQFSGVTNVDLILYARAEKDGNNISIDSESASPTSGFTNNRLVIEITGTSETVHTIKKGEGQCFIYYIQVGSVTPVYNLIDAAKNDIKNTVNGGFLNQSSLINTKEHEILSAISAQTTVIKTALPTDYAKQISLNDVLVKVNSALTAMSKIMTDLTDFKTEINKNILDAKNEILAAISGGTVENEIISVYNVTDTEKPTKLLSNIENIK